MLWFTILVVFAGLVILVRLYFKIRDLRKLKIDSWDEKRIASLRSKGYAPFNDYPVDFFIALPSETACDTVRTQLESEGYKVDTKPVTEDPEYHFSLHATKMMRLIVPIMQETTAHLTQVAAQAGGRYDGWAA
jgi:hypothetical protein